MEIERIGYMMRINPNLKNSPNKNNAKAKVIDILKIKLKLYLYV